MQFLILPSGIVVLLVVVALVMAVFARARRHAWWALAGASVVYVVFASGPVAFELLSSLERRYTGISEPVDRDIDTIVVLAAYAERNWKFAPDGRINRAAGLRLFEAVRIYRQLRNARVVISGREVVPEIMRDTLVKHGIPLNRIVLESASSSTYESGVNLRSIVGDKRFVLVTSAGHMPRAMAVMKKQQLNAVPAPTDFMVLGVMQGRHMWPTSEHLLMSDLAVHEHLGMWWYALSDHI